MYKLVIIVLFILLTPYALVFRTHCSWGLKHGAFHCEPFLYLPWTFHIDFRTKEQYIWNVIWEWSSVFLWPRATRIDTKLIPLCEIKDPLLSTFLLPTQFSALIGKILSSRNCWFVLFSFRLNWRCLFQSPKDVHILVNNIFIIPQNKCPATCVCVCVCVCVWERD